MNRLTVRCNTPVQGSWRGHSQAALGELWPLVKEAGEGHRAYRSCGA